MDLDVWEDQGSKKIIAFLEAAIHNVVYTRRLYPSSSFTSKQIYGVPIKMCTHPGVSGYITSCLKRIEELLNTSEIESVHLVLEHENSEPLESIVFNFTNAYTSKCLQDFLLKESITLFEQFCRNSLSASHSHLCPRPTSSSFKIEIVTSTAAWQSILLNPGHSNSLWCESQRPMETLGSLEAEISPVESFNTSLLSVHNVIYATNSATHNTIHQTRDSQNT